MIVDKSIDWWTLGVLLYEMMSGLPPFYDEVTDKMYHKILTVCPTALIFAITSKL